MMAIPILDRIVFALGWICSCESAAISRERGVLVRILRGTAGALLWIVSAVLGLAAVVLCITVILLPIGLPLLGVARRLFGIAVRLMLPREVAHPVKQGRKRL